MRVLVIDDNGDFRLLCARAMAACGHDVEVLPSAFGLVNKVAGASGPPPDVVVLDCDLPGLSGNAAIELLARDRRTQSVPVLLVSAVDSAANRDAARQHPLAVFMKKDGHLRKMVERMEQHVASVAVAQATAGVKNP
jgi:DNA-binding response OmpR family regulator